MADNDIEQDSLFKEIDEDLREERYAKLWKQYGNYLIAAAVILVAAVAGFQAWRAWDQSRRADDATRFAGALKAVAENRNADAARQLALLTEEGSSGYALLARFNSAALLARAGDQSAAPAFMAIAGDSGVDSIYRDLALVLATLQELDRGDPQSLIDRLKPLTATSNPWRHSAKEMTALLARRQGDSARAGKLFRELADDITAPQGIRARAAELAAIIGK